MSDRKILRVSPCLLEFDPETDTITPVVAICIISSFALDLLMTTTSLLFLADFYGTILTQFNVAIVFIYRTRTGKLADKEV
jgi:hypothetical protein